jgi:hypothetical protein
MRIPILICAALALTACGGKSTAGNSAATEENAASEAVVTNDVTAIDAATGEAANMAPDVNYTLNEANLESGVNTSNTTAAPHKPPRKAAKPAAAATNSVETAPASNSI